MCMQHAPCPSCVWLHITQSDLVFNHLLHMNTGRQQCQGKDSQQQQQQYDETPPEIAPKMAAGLTRKQEKKEKKMCLICRRRAVSLNWIKLHGASHEMTTQHPFILWAPPIKTPNHSRSWCEQWLQGRFLLPKPVN